MLFLYSIVVIQRISGNFCSASGLKKFHIKFASSRSSISTLKSSKQALFAALLLHIFKETLPEAFCAAPLQKAGGSWVLGGLLLCHCLLWVVSSVFLQGLKHTRIIRGMNESTN